MFGVGKGLNSGWQVGSVLPFSYFVLTCGARSGGLRRQYRRETRQSLLRQVSMTFRRRKARVCTVPTWEKVGLPRDRPVVPGMS